MGSEKFYYLIEVIHLSSTWFKPLEKKKKKLKGTNMTAEKFINF